MSSVGVGAGAPCDLLVLYILSKADGPLSREEIRTTVAERVG